MVDPILPKLPATLDPNVITHVGHALCLSALALVLLAQPARGLLVLLVGVLLQAYLWCDNADGAHARRTGRTSAVGEYLDHGLDLLNSMYIGVVSAFSLGTSSTGTLVIATLIAGASAVTCFEQAATGVYRLGLFNQIEAILLVTFVLTLDALFGRDFTAHVGAFGVTMQEIVFGVATSTLLFGMAHAMVRVRAAKASVLPALILLALYVTAVAARATNAVSTAAALTLCAAVTVTFGARMLAARLRREKPKAAVGELLAVLVMAVIIATRGKSLLIEPSDIAWALAASSVVAGGWHLRTIAHALAALPRPAAIVSMNENRPA